MEKASLIGNIKDQGRALRYCFENREEYLELARKVAKNNIKKIYVVGSGSSYHAAVVIKYYFQNLCNVETNYIMPNLFTYHENTNPNNELSNDQIMVIGISQSGNSTTTLGSLRKSYEAGYVTIGVTEKLESRMANSEYPIIHLLCGIEGVPPETRGYTVTEIMLYLFAVELAYRSNKISEEKYSLLIKEAEDFVNNFDKFIEESILWFNRNKEEIFEAKNFGITGYGLNYGTAIEAQLKLYECTHLPSVGYEAEEFSHGHVFAYSKDNYLFTIGSKGKELERLPRMNNFYKDKVTKHVFLITAEDVEVTGRDLKFSQNYCDELLAIAYIVPFQIVASEVADYLGLDTSYFEIVHNDWPARD